MSTQDYDAVNSIRFHGRPLRLRELRAADRPRIETLLTQVAPADLQLRFFDAFCRIPPGLLDRLLRIDPRDRLTVVAVLESAGSHDAEILGVARAHRMGEHAAEAALLVRSGPQRTGAGHATARQADWPLPRMGRFADDRRGHAAQQPHAASRGEVRLSLRSSAGRHLSSRPRSEGTARAVIGDSKSVCKELSNDRQPAAC